MTSMDDLTLAYLAGCLDSDGYFTIRLDHGPKSIVLGQSPVLHEEIGLRQVTPVVPYMLQAAFGGTVYQTRAYPAQGRPLYSWTVLALKASVAARTVLPFLRIKGDQAQALLDLRAAKEAWHGRRPLTPEEIASRQAIRTRVQTLNGH